MITDITFQFKPLPKKADPLADLIYKKCNGCGDMKFLSDFHINNRNLDGRRRKCAHCRGIVYARYRHNARVKLRIKQAYRRAGFRVPGWLTEDCHNKIKDIYKDAYDQYKEVDHEIPLNGKRVSGLHVPSNLKIVSAHDNRKKYNKF